MWYDQTGLKRLKFSTKILTLDAAILSPGACLFEGTNLSEGRGTMKPFENIGAPYIDGAVWAKALNDEKLRGVEFIPVEFTPKSIPNMATRPKRLGEKCGGVLVKVTDRDVLEPVRVSVAMLVTARKLYPDSFQWLALPMRVLNLLIVMLLVFSMTAISQKAKNGVVVNGIYAVLQEGKTPEEARKIGR